MSAITHSVVNNIAAIDAAFSNATRVTLVGSITTSNPAYKNFAIQTFVPGAILFVISDALLATNKFYAHLPVFDLGVMLTYAGAQYFLTKGFISIKKVSHP